MTKRPTFKEFLNELMMDVDIEDPQKAQLDVRQKIRMAQASPERVNRELALKAKQERQQAAASEGPTKALDMQIAKKKEELAMLQRRRNSMTKQQPQQQQGVEPPV